MPKKPAGAEWAPAPTGGEQFRYRAAGGGSARAGAAQRAAAERLRQPASAERLYT